MKITLKALKYDFRGQRQDLTFGGKTLISGKNGSGKSTTLNALLWLLTGYDVDDVANSNLFDNRTEDSPENPKSAKVTAIFDVDGRELKLTKEAKQVWKRPRGKVEYERGNDTYNYYVDDLETPARDYAELVEETFGKGEKLKLMLNSDYWEMLDEKTLRKHFLAIVGEINDKDFVNNDYTPLFPLLHTTTPDGKPKEVSPDEVRQTFMNRIRELKEAQTKQKASLDAQTENLIDTSEVEDAEKQIATLKEERESIDAHLLGLVKVDEEYRRIRMAEEEAIMKAETQLRMDEVDYHTEYNYKMQELKNKLNDALAHNRNLDSEEARLKRLIEDCESVIRTKELERAQKLKEVEQIDLRKFDGNCPYCGNALTGANRAEAITLFKEKQSIDKSLAIEQGKRIKAQLDEAKERLPKIQEELANLKRIDPKAIRIEMEELEKNHIPFYCTEQSKAIQKNIAEMKANRTKIQDDPDLEQGQIRKGEIDAELSKLYKVVGKRDERKKQEGKIEELKAMLRQTADALAENERMKMLIEEYQKEQSEIIRVRANRLFEKVEVVMEEMNKSGNIVPCCKMRIDGVVSTANTANRTRIGFEVSRAFQRHYDKVLPLFLDRAESLNDANVPQPDGQLVLLKVTEEDFKVESL